MGTLLTMCRYENADFRRRQGFKRMSKSSIALSNLRALVIIIVVAFHACLAYLASAPAPQGAFDQPPYHWQAFPIVDAHHWLGLDIFCAWQDVSLMSLMFLLSGLFAAGSLRRKGGSTYVSDRIWRIGVPFLLAAIILSPLAYYPAYLQRSADPSVVGFWQQWFSLPFWPSGPEWFLWQLFMANALGAALYALAPRSASWLGRLVARADERPFAFLAILAAASVLAYVPLALAFSPWKWSALGPFSLQLCRPLQYLVFFFAGFALGARGLERGLLTSDGALARRWPVFLAAAVVSFLAWAGLTSLTMPNWGKAAFAAQLAAALAFPIASAAGALFLLAVSLRFAARLRLWIVDSLSANAYTMYLLHYVFVVWLQYVLLGSDIFVVGKAAIVLAGALTLSWTTSLAFHAAAVPRVLAVRRAISPVPR